MELLSLVAKVRSYLKGSSGEAPSATLARALYHKTGIAIDAELLRRADAAHITAVLSLLGASASSHTHTVSQLSNASANGRSLISAADYAAMKVLLSLGNVDNTADASKPVSTATQTALDLKADTISGVFTTPEIDGVPYSALNKRQVITTAFAITGAALHAANLTAVQFPADAIILRAVLDVTTVSTGAATIDIGYTAVSATTASATLLDDVDVNTTVAVFDTINDVAVLPSQKAASGKWITVHENADTTGLVATLYVQFIRA